MTSGGLESGEHLRRSHSSSRSPRKKICNSFKTADTFASSVIVSKVILKVILKGLKPQAEEYDRLLAPKEEQ